LIIADNCDKQECILTKEDLQVDGRTMLKLILEKSGGWMGVEWIYLAQDWDQEELLSSMELVRCKY
jgi:hypothetical protein